MHYWEVVLERFMNDDLFVGVARSSINVYQSPRYDTGWYFLAADGGVGANDMFEGAERKKKKTRKKTSSSDESMKETKGC